MKRELCEATGYPAERVRVMPLWFDAARIQNASRSPKLRERLGLTDERLVLFVGRLAPNKRVPLLIEAIAELADEQPPIHAVIIGDSGDIYRAELERCRELANRLGVADRVHFLGHVSENELAEAYAGADLFAMPSVHEGFCIPLLEAMAAGLPVIASRAAALPETVAGAGLTFTPDDADDLARQISRVLSPVPAAPIVRRIAVVSPKYGEKVLGGAERSLRLIAETLAEAGREVEVFTTGPGESNLDGVPIHRFAEGDLRALPHLDSFDAVIAGPYGSDLALAVAAIAPERMILVPCFHDEPAARDPSIAARYSRVAGLLYHSAAERRLAETELGVSHPNSAVIGTWLAEQAGDAERGRKLAGGDRPYLLYCGRYCREKNTPLLIDWLKRYELEHPNRFRFVFTGHGDAKFPKNSNWRDLGFVTEQEKADLLAGAAALVQLSTNESLSLAALEALNLGTPVIAHRDCAAIRDQLDFGGGALVGDYDEFRDSLDDLWSNPEAWFELGRIGQASVQKRFGSRNEFIDRINAVMDGLERPLSEVMRERGSQAANRRSEESWKQAFTERVESVLHRDPIPLKFAVAISPRHGHRFCAGPAPTGSPFALKMSERFR